MKPLFLLHPKVRRFFSKAGSLMLLFQKTPVVQMILPEARVMGTTGVAELVKWTVASVAGLGVYDTVAGATALTQIAPTPVVSPINTTAGTAFSLTAQVTGAPGNPQSWSISAGSLPPGISLPPGVTSSSTGSTCTLSGVPTTAGTFNFTLRAWRFTNTSGESTAKAFSIVVAAVVPTITKNPASVTINSGSTTTLTVAATGTSPTFQWYIGNAGNTGNPIAGATSPSYTTPALTANTNYWARASNSAGFDNSTAATVTVITPPNITTNPAPATINSGTTKTLTVAASGTAPITFQWYIGNSGVTTSPISGATSASYTTPALTSNTTYWARATNDAGNDDSTAATITVRVPPTITTNPASITINSGSTTTLTVAASGTAPTFQWYIGPSGTITNPIAGATSTSYTTPALTTSTTYWARASNAASTDDSTAATVTVRIPPAFTTHPASATINSGTTKTLTVAASGTSPTFQWYIGNSGITTTPIAGATAANYTPPALTATTTYWVKATNLAGNANSNAATLTVIQPPAITTHPAPVSINSGSTATLTVISSGTSPTFQWYLGLTGDQSNPVSGATSTSFTTPTLTADARYWVRATNAAGSANSNAALVSVTAAVATFADWQSSQFNSTQLADSAVSGATADPDGDGISNAKEYVFGLLPLTANVPPTPAITTSAGQFSVSFTAKAASGPGYAGKTRHYALETSDTLIGGTWTSPAGYEDIIATDQNVIFNGPQTGTTRFYQARVWLTP